MSQLNFKATNPERTIQKARTILHDCGIFTIEHWVHNPNLPLSVRVQIHNLPIGTNGKGRTYPYALASGYGEFLERLQNLILFNDSKYIGNQGIEGPNYKDAIELPLQHFKDHSPDILQYLIGSGKIDELNNFFEDDRVKAVPFLNMITGETVYIPLPLLEMAIGSNGMAAGNTPAETLIQGLSEVYERFVVKEIFKKDSQVSFPVVPDSFLVGSGQWDFIQHIRSHGYEVIVKDCSLNGKYPVVGVLIVKNNKAMFNLGACPNFGVALERCLTEILQGSQFGQLEHRMQPIVSLDTPTDKVFSSKEKQACYQYFFNLTTSQGVVHPVIFDHSTPFDENNIYNSTDVISETAWHKMLTDAKEAGLHVLCRDVSWLGFNSYQIYVPGLSEVMQPNMYFINLLLHQLPRARKTIFNLESASNDDILNLIRVLEELIDEPIFLKVDTLALVYGLSFGQKVSLHDMAPETIIAMLYYIIGHYNQAHKTLKDYLINTLGPEDFTSGVDYAQDQLCLCSFFDLLNNGVSLDSIPDALKPQYPTNTIDAVYDMLNHKELVSDYLDIPHCNDCVKCDYQKVCHFPPWKNLRDKIQGAINQASYDHIEGLKPLIV
jgi:ribosomal protein S12 methylthiotransferase accessory factor